MELFRLFGTILVDNEKANKSISKTESQAKGSSDGMASAFKKVGTALTAAFSVQKILQFGQACIDAYNVQVEAEQKLETIMKQRFNATDQSIQSVKDYASAIQNVGVVGDEVQLSGAQQLATFLKTDEALKTLMPAMANLAVQQNGVNVTSENMVSIGNMVGKVMQGQTSALTRVGITFTEAQEAALKYGTEQERAAVLAQIITDNVGNMNEVMAQTDAGKIQQAKNAFGDLQEEIGARVIPIQALFYTGLNTVTSFISEYVLPAYDSMKSKLSDFITTVMESETAQQVFTALKNVVDVLRSAWDEIFPHLQVLFGAFSDFLMTAWNGILKPVFEFVMSILGDLYDMFCEYFPIIAETVGNAFDLISQFYYGVLKPVLDVIISYVKNTLLPTWNVVWGTIKTVVGTVFTTITSYWNNILYPLFSGIIDFISNVFAGNWSGAWNSIKNTISNVWDGIKQMTSDTWNKVYSLIQTPMNNAKNFIKGIIDTIKGFFNFKLSFPHIALPHFSIRPSGWSLGDLLKGSIPSLGIRWYKKAYTEPYAFDQPTVTQVGGKMIGVGDGNGKEVVYGHAQLMEDIRQANRESSPSDELLMSVLERMDKIIKSMSRPIILDGGAIVGYMLDDIDSGLGNIASLKLRKVK